MREQPTIIWQARQGPNARSTYESYKAVDEIASLHPARVVIAGADRDDLYQLLKYAQRRHLAPALRMPSHVTREEIRAMHRNGVNRMIFRVESAFRVRHDALHGAGAFGTTLRAMRFAADERISIEVETLVCRRTVDELPRIAEVIAAFGAVEWFVIFPVPPLPAGAEMITAAEAERAFATLRSSELICNLTIRTVEAPHYVRFGGDTIRDVVFIGGNGEVRTSEYAPIVAGNIRYQPLRTLAPTATFTRLNDPALLRGKCGRCEFRSACGGSRARAWAMTGNLFASDPLCSYQPSAS